MDFMHTVIQNSEATHENDFILQSDWTYLKHKSIYFLLQYMQYHPLWQYGEWRMGKPKVGLYVFPIAKLCIQYVWCKFHY